MLTHKEDIQLWLDDKRIVDYIINDDLTVDVRGSVWLSGFRLTEIPVQFGTVTGNFICGGNTAMNEGKLIQYENLKSLKGAPRHVGQDFRCQRARLTSLEGAPETVEGEFDCSYNKLTTLEHFPKKIGSHIDVSYCELTSLKGVPEHVTGDFDCKGNNLTSLEGAPELVEGEFDCSNNYVLTTLKGAPKIIKGDDARFSCCACSLKNLVGIPEYIGENLECFSNPIEDYSEALSIQINGYFKSDHGESVQEAINATRPAMEHKEITDDLSDLLTTLPKKNSERL